MACTFKSSLSGQCNNIHLSIGQLYWLCGLNLQGAVWATYWSPWWPTYHKTIGNATTWLAGGNVHTKDIGTLTYEAFHLYVKTVQQAKEQAFDKQHSNKHAKAQVPTNWTQTKSFSPYNREGERNISTRAKHPFPERAVKRNGVKITKSSFFFFPKKKMKNKKRKKSLWCFYSYTNILHKCCNDISKFSKTKT